jgi:hypothetical protein
MDEPALRPPPVRVEGRLEEPSRWLWLFKWLLALPHYIVLFFLVPAFFLCSVAAFVAVMFSGRYPRSLFDFNLGVLRWGWRVAFYGYGANGTDRYPPFTLGEAPDYPARLDVDYPEYERPGLSLIGWWLAGIPQYLVAGVFIGGGGAVGWTAFTGSWGGATWFGLIGLLVLAAVIVLLFTGSYPQSIFDFVLGLNRWVLRVVAYAAVMTAEYPPFRVDPGESEPAGPMSVASTPASEASEPLPRPWGPGRIAAVVGAAIATLIAVLAIVAGGVAIVLNQTQRDASGYLMTSPRSYTTATYALVSGSGRFSGLETGLLGTVRITERSTDAVFVGIAPAGAATTYLAGVERAQASGFDPKSADFHVHPGGAPKAPPSSERFWVASAVGASEKSLVWKIRGGDWRVVAMNANGSRNVSVALSIGARFPNLLTIGIAVLGAGILLALLGGGGLFLAIRKIARSTRSPKRDGSR